MLRGEGAPLGRGERNKNLSACCSQLSQSTCWMSGMIIVSNLRNYHLYRKETDMRKGFDSLCGIIRNELNQPVMNGDAFIFINRSRTHLQLLVWEQRGFTIFYRRLEKGLLDTCKMHEINPYVWLKDILRKIAT